MFDAHHKPFLQSLSAGLLSGGLFLLVASLGLGFFFLFLPTLPLLVVGLGKEPRLAVYGACIAAAIIAVTAGVDIAVLFFACFGLPSWYIASRSVLWRANGGIARTWFPLGPIFTNLTLYACAGVAVIAAVYAGEPGGIAQFLARSIRGEFKGLEAQYGDIVELLAVHWSFLVFSTSIWLWGLLLYAHAWFANRLLMRNGRNIRPDFAIRNFSLPNWMFYLLAICALASLIGGESMRLLGKSTLIALLLPYFFLGAALMHAASLTWPNRRIFLFFIYFTILSQFWPALILSGVGIWHHIKLAGGHKLG